MTNLLNKKNKKNKKKGFTLMELIIVLAVMAIIAAIAIPSFTAVRDNSKLKADKQSCQTIRRMALTLVADETLSGDSKATAAATYVYTPSDKKGKATSIAKGETELNKALADVKAPQNTTGGTYTIEITNTGTVAVYVTDNKTNTLAN